jgi:hypothetical protein
MLINGSGAKPMSVTSQSSIKFQCDRALFGFHFAMFLLPNGRKLGHAWYYSRMCSAIGLPTIDYHLYCSIFTFRYQAGPSA